MLRNFSRPFGALTVLLTSLLAVSACGGDVGESGAADAGTSSDTVQVLGDGSSSGACSPLGATRCVGNVVELCAEAGWILDEVCGESGLTCREGLCQTIFVDCATITPIRTILNEPTLSSVAVVFAVDTCDGQPVAGLAVDDFTILEDDKKISTTEAQAAILSRTSSVYISLVMDNSPSVAAVGALEQAVESALIFVEEVMSGTATKNVFVSVSFFSKKLEMIQDYTTDIDLVMGALEYLLNDDSGSNTTNLYGALIDAISENESHRTDVENAADGGIIAIGQIVLFTDGSDQAALASYEEATAAVLQTDADVITISLGGELELSVLETLGKNGAYVASESDQLLSTFEEAAQKAKALQKRVYVLGYCSPKLAGVHELTLVLGDDLGTSPGITFDADPFNSDVATCSSSLFESACDTKSCGGLLCGACDGAAYCLSGDRCPCDGLTCGTEAGLDCGSCSGSTEYCAPDQSECLDACGEVMCGPGQVNCGYDFHLPDCCSAHETPGCEIAFLEQEICSWLGLDECCDEVWDETCALAVNTYFGFICEVPEDVNSECVAESITCGTCDSGSFCSADQSACTNACMNDGGQPLVCEEGYWSSEECPGGLVELSNCCFAHAGADCDTGGSFELGQMKSEVCAVKPECCDTAWDDSCVELAKGVYGWNQGCVPTLGDCIAYGPLDCGSCDEGHECSDDQLACLNMCLTADGEAVVCGTSPIDYVTDCGTCGDGEVCAPNGTECGDLCAGMDCGISTIDGETPCGSCTGTDYCLSNVCTDACEGLVCGPSPIDGTDCGSCLAGEFCSPDGTECGDACAGLVCGTSPYAPETNCGTCPGGLFCSDGTECIEDAGLKLAAGIAHSCVVDSGIVTCWGAEGNYTDSEEPTNVGQLDVPEGMGTCSDIETRFTYNCCKIGSTNSWECWGDDIGPKDVPPEPFIQVALGGLHACGLRANGSIDCWGAQGTFDDGMSWDVGQLSAPPGTYIQVVSGNFHSCGVRTDGAVQCWGYDDMGGTVSGVPAGSFLQIAAGWFHTCGVKTDGSVTCWGDPYQIGESVAPGGTFQAVDAGRYHSCGLKTDGTITCWGYEEYTNAPTGTFVDLEVGAYHSLATREDGTIACWGFSGFGACNVPAQWGAASCSGLVCGTSPVDGSPCGSCNADTYCSEDQTACLDSCTGLLCGTSPLDGSSCGSCSAGTYCSEDQTACLDSCTGLLCGTSPFDGMTDCGSCEGGQSCSADQASCIDMNEGCGQNPSSTCSGSCGGNAGGCWCDDQCEGFGDCCPDKAACCG